MKPTYKKADAEVVLFDNSDIITTSGGDDINGDSGKIHCIDPGKNSFDNAFK